ncbi:MAG: metalloregulator ArsR/SmtB family transcription factor [Planctomycetota bacterium]|nr:metalloregulator ArsR/SmtB family transcription factor [Planctomycetota bacterium]
MTSDLASSHESIAMPKKDPLQPERCAELLSALAAPERLKIVRFLADGRHNVTEIADMLAIPAVNVSHHLQVLKVSQLIQGKKKGRFVWYSLQPGVLEEAMKDGVPGDALNLGCCQLVLPLGEGGAASGGSNRKC